MEKEQNEKINNFLDITIQRTGNNYHPRSIENQQLPTLLYTTSPVTLYNTRYQRLTLRSTDLTPYEKGIQELGEEHIKIHITAKPIQIKRSHKTNWRKRKTRRTYATRKKILANGSHSHTSDKKQNKSQKRSKTPTQK
jgi:hypothetical protein